MSFKLGEFKVQVRSKYREVTAKSFVDYERDGAGNPVEIAYFRTFHEHEAWMTPEEADFLFNSPENQAHIEQGFAPLYSFPQGQAVPVPANFGDGKFVKPGLEPPLGESGITTSDPRQADAARRQRENAERILAKKDKAAGKAPSEPPAKDPPAGPAVSAARRARSKGNDNKDEGAQEGAAAEPAAAE